MPRLLRRRPFAGPPRPAPVAAPAAGPPSPAAALPFRTALVLAAAAALAPAASAASDASAAEFGRAQEGAQERVDPAAPAATGSVAKNPQVEAMALPGWLRFDRRAQWRHLYEDSLVPEVAALEQERRAAREAARMLAEARRDGSPLEREAAADILARHRERVLSLERSVAATQARLRAITSVWHWPNPLDWLRHHLGAFLLLAAIWLIGRWAARAASRAYLRRAERRLPDGNRDARSVQRARTLTSFATRFAEVVLTVVVLFGVLGEFGASTGILAAGAGIVGLALTFGSQDAVRDVVTGFFMLLERQLAIGDIVRLDGLTGTVEDFSLRMTRLRDDDGIVHFIPNGRIGTLSNLTHEFALALVDFTVPRAADPDRVFEVLQGELDAFATDEEWRELVIDAPKVLGVESVARTTATYRVSVMIHPQRREQVKRELLRRVPRALAASSLLDAQATSGKAAGANGDGAAAPGGAARDDPDAGNATR